MWLQLLGPGDPDNQQARTRRRRSTRNACLTRIIHLRIVDARYENGVEVIRKRTVLIAIWRQPPSVGRSFRRRRKPVNPNGVSAGIKNVASRALGDRRRGRPRWTKESDRRVCLVPLGALLTVTSFATSWSTCRVRPMMTACTRSHGCATSRSAGDPVRSGRVDRHRQPANS